MWNDGTRGAVDAKVDAFLEAAEDQLNRLEDELAAENNLPPIKTMADMESEYAAYAEKLKRVAQRTENALVLFTNTEEGTGEYAILYSRLDSAEKALDWIRHLVQKQWVTTTYIRQLVATASDLGAKFTDA